MFCYKVSKWFGREERSENMKGNFGSHRNGKKMSVDLWAAGQPDDKGGSESCVVLAKDDAHKGDGQKDKGKRGDDGDKKKKKQSEGGGLRAKDTTCKQDKLDLNVVCEYIVWKDGFK